MIITKRPLCFLCLLFIGIQGILLLTGGYEPQKIPASSVFYGQEKKTVDVRGQVYKKENTSNIQFIYLKNNSVPDSKLLIYDKEHIDIPIGKTIYLRGETGFFENSRNPGNYDAALSRACEGIYGFIWCREVKDISGSENRLMETLFRLKTKWRTALVDAMGDDNGSILSAILLGDKKNLDSGVKEMYQKTGIGHVLAISGLHLSFLGLSLYHLLRKGGLPFLPAGILAAGTLLLYVLMVGFSASVFRAFVMLMFRVGADITGYAYDRITALLFAAALSVMYRPLYLAEAGFYLSYGAVLGILLVVPALEKSVKGGKKKLPPAISAILGCLGVNLMLFPVLLWFYFEFPPYSILWNLPVLASMSLVLGLGVLGSFFLPWWKMAGNVCLKACGLILKAYGIPGSLGRYLPADRIVMGKPEIWEIILYYAILFLLIFFFRKKRKGKAWLWIIIAIPIMLMGHHPSSGLAVTMLDLGQGDGIFIRGPEGRACMIDGGSSDVPQTGKYRIEPFIKSQGIGTLDYVFITHGDADHINGIQEMIGRMDVGVKIKRLVLPSNYRNDKALNELAKTARDKGVDTCVIRAGQVLSEGSLRITCIQPSDGDKDISGNEGSMVLDISYGDFSMLCTGDTEGEGEKKLTKRISGKEYDILKVAHHGSANSTSAEFLSAANPKIALISAGKGNRYGHPAKDTINRLLDKGCRIIKTMDTGAIMIGTDGNSLTISFHAFRL